MRVGLTGGIGAGKTAVAALFAAWGAVVIDYDVLAREAVGAGMPALAAIAARWPEVIDARGTLDRGALGRLVFADAAARRELGAIVHPRVREAAAVREAQAPAGALVVHVVPLLFEGDTWRTFDRTVVVTAPDEVRLARVTARDGLPAADVAARMAAQIEPRAALALASAELRNDGDRPQLEARARALFDLWQAERRADAAGY